MFCKIRWIDKNGKRTPDKNLAIGEVQCLLPGETNSEWFPICKEHAQRLKTENLTNWTFRESEKLRRKQRRASRRFYAQFYRWLEYQRKYSN